MWRSCYFNGSSCISKSVIGTLSKDIQQVQHLVPLNLTLVFEHNVRVEDGQAQAEEHEQAREHWYHFPEAKLVGIAGKDDYEDEDIYTNSDKVVALNIALVSFECLAHELVCLDA